MSTDRDRFAFFWLVALAAILIGGCGSSGPSSTVERTTSTQPSRQFLDSPGHDPLVEFGREAPAFEREAGSAILEESFEARASADFKAQCATLSARELERVASNGKKGSPAQCAEKLQKLAKPLTKSKAVRADRMAGSVAAMRMKGNRGFALFHGTDGKDWVMPLEKEGGVWKVAAIQEEELPSRTSQASPSKAARPPAESSG